jgi:hypothetical protein
MMRARSSLFHLERMQMEYSADEIAAARNLQYLAVRRFLNTTARQ